LRKKVFLPAAQVIDADGSRKSDKCCPSAKRNYGSCFSRWRPELHSAQAAAQFGYSQNSNRSYVLGKLAVNADASSFVQRRGAAERDRDRRERHIGMRPDAVIIFVAFALTSAMIIEFTSEAGSD
jgi:hypothetical protein